jgi:oxazoline/thiazoline dehydrogenase
MPRPYVLAFAKGLTVERPSPNHVMLRMTSASTGCSLKGISSGLVRAIDVLSSSGATEDELANLVEELDGAHELTRLYYYLLMFSEHRMLSYGIALGDGRLATLAPSSPSFCFSPVAIHVDSKYILSKFAYLHRDGEGLVLESPVSHGKITLHGWAGAALMGELAKAQTLESLCGMVRSVPLPVVTLFLEMLLSERFLSELKAGETLAEENEVLGQWDFHDLVFHARSRLGRHIQPYGGTYRFRNRIKALPAVKQFQAAQAFDLHRPDIGSLVLKDSPFTKVLEERRSVREYGERPITDRQLGEFLYRTARVKELCKTEFQELSSRPYPSGGAVYELELYVNIRSCENISPGFYHYCPWQHRLEKISDPTNETEALLKDAQRSAGVSEGPQILITIAARFQRVFWKYESMAYSLLLKNVGVLYQTMYLVATAMDLAPCALGGGDSDLFARAARLDYYAETSVGEFLLGSRRN